MANLPTQLRAKVPPSTVVALALVSIALGAALRFAWPADMEYKGDERYVFERTQLIGAPGAWPALGMPSSAGVRNPAMSVWVFALLARAFDVTTPTGLAIAVMGLNVAALVLLFVFSMTLVEEPERERWLWALALVAVNPLAVLLQRKIWAPSVFPAFAVVYWAGWWRRDRRFGAFVWGAVGALLGQIQMSGFFFAAGVAGWEAITGCRKSGRRVALDATTRSPRWVAWVAGSAIGALPMVPWVRYLLRGPPSSGTWDWRELVTPRFWLYGATDSLGLGLHYNLSPSAFLEFLRYPAFAGAPTYAVGIAHALVAAVGILLVAHGLMRVSGTRSTRRPWREVWRAWTTARTTATGRALRSTFIAYGVLLTSSGLVIYRHYLLVTYPLEWVFLVGLALTVERHGRRLLAVLWASQLVLTTAFLFYIHSHCGAPGDYGVAYRCQAAETTSSVSDAAANSQVTPSK